MDNESSAHRISESEFSEFVESAKEPENVFDAGGKPVLMRHLEKGRSSHGQGKPLDVSRVQTFEEREGKGTSVMPLSRRSVDDVPEPLERRSHSSSGQGVEPRRQRSHDVAERDKKPLSRWVKRGVQYPESGKAMFSMAWVLLSRIVLYVVVIGTPIIVIWVSQAEDNALLWKFLPVFGAFLILGIGHLVIAGRLKCKICSCPLLFSRRCHKNSKAHPKFPLGHVGSTALHGLIFRWFRCMYCGTAVQLGKKKN